jgi:S-adenosylmethionine/arginine decarboxylase-like enzyme
MSFSTRLSQRASSNCSTTSGFTILRFVEHTFVPQGYTALWLLGESHAAVHTFPEHNRTYVELSSCRVDLLRTFDHLINQSGWVDREPDRTTMPTNINARTLAVQTST